MWGGLFELAEKAKQAAENLDKQLNESVGIVPGTSPENANLSSIVPPSFTEALFGTPANTADDEDDDNWDEDDNNLIDVVDGGFGEHPSNDIDLTKSPENEEFDQQPIINESVNSAEPSVEEELKRKVESLVPANDSFKQSEIENVDLSNGEGWDGDEIDIDQSNDSINLKESAIVVGSNQANNEALVTVIEAFSEVENNNASQKTLLTEDFKENLQEGQESSESKINESLESSNPVDASQEPKDSNLQTGLNSGEVTESGDNQSAELKGEPGWDTDDIEITESEAVEEGTIEPEETLLVNESATQSLQERKELSDVESQSNEATELEVIQNEPKSEHETTVPQQHLPPQDLSLFMQQQAEYTAMMEKQLEELAQRLEQREKQLISKNEQLAELESTFEIERQDLLQKVQLTKDEAKRRIAKAKEKVDALERQFNSVRAAQSGTAEAIAQKDEIIAALRSEGEKLARKQADMEKAVRAAKTEARETRESMVETIAAKEEGLLRISSLEEELTETKEALASARRGESQADKLDLELKQVREESERRQATIISMEQQLKELKAKVKDLGVELDEAKKGAAVESEQERKKFIKEQNDLVNDLENTIRVTQREAAVREDALRHEVEEIRKRWQDAVRRADSLSIDIQSSTAPLLRQLESINKQNRTRAAAWAELETQLRTELEDNIVLNEKLSKERNDWKSKFARIERLYKEQEEEVKQLKIRLEEQTTKADKLEDKLQKMEEDTSKKQEEWAEVEKLANEGVSRVRSEMTKTVLESEERYRAHLETVKSELNKERELRCQLEKQVEGLIENAGVFTPQEMPTQIVMKEESKPKKLRESEGQVSILASTLGGLSIESDDETDAETDENSLQRSSRVSSFAAFDQLTSSLKAAKHEVIVLRQRLEESEKTREGLVEALAESRNAKEKLPLFEARVKELSEQNLELTHEVDGLREDIADVQELYRTQLNLLLEEKASAVTKDNVVINVGEHEEEMMPPASEIEQMS